MQAGGESSLAIKCTPRRNPQLIGKPVSAGPMSMGGTHCMPLLEHNLYQDAITEIKGHYDRNCTVAEE